MLFLEKIYIENFKGVSTPKTIDFGSHELIVLDGPNGFGKTTLFDVIEMCLRGRLERTTTFGRVQKDSSDYSKAFYQNTRGKNVIIKVQFKDRESNVSHIIAKFLDGNHNGKQGTGRSFKPDAWGILETYYSNDPDTFSLDFDVNNFRPISQAEVDTIFYGDQGLSLVNLFPLFNYLQQEENIFFLKKGEEEKKQELNFLFQTQSQTEEIDQIGGLQSKLRGLRDALTTRIAALGDSSALPERVEYVRLFSTSEIGYDAQEPFAHSTPEGIAELAAAHSKNIEYLREFIISFDLAEFKKAKLKEALVAVERNDNFLAAFALQDMFRPSNYEHLVRLSAKRILYQNALRTIQDDDLDPDLILELGFDAEFSERYYTAVKDKDLQQKTFTETEVALNELVELRTEIIGMAASLYGTTLSDTNCPLCDTRFNTAEQLSLKIAEKTEKLIAHNKQKLGHVAEANRVIQQDFRDLIIVELEKFLNIPDNALDPAFYARLIELRGHSDSVARFMALLSESGISFSSSIVQSTISNELLDDVIDKLRAQIATVIATLIPDESKLINKHLFKEYFDERAESIFTVEEVDNKKLYILYKYDEARLFSLNVLSGRLQAITEVETKVGGIKTAMTTAVTEYKHAMIEKVKMPFYLYSGKILQNYQQGFGIFLEMNPGTNKVRFLTNSESDHDIIHHLSSGQLAVVSIAFCLSLNKVYHTNNRFKFLAIDDPIQTLDEVNVHSLIELMRHEFSGYQIILSTHEDDLADYMKYKFSAFGFNTKKLNVQKELYA